MSCAVCWCGPSWSGVGRQDWHATEVHTAWQLSLSQLEIPRGVRNPRKWNVAPRQVSPSQYRSVPINLIQKRVSEYFQLRELRNRDLRVRSKRRFITFPRQLAMYIARHITTASLEEIGRQFGGMHHTTVLHSIRKIDTMRRSDENLDRTITRLVDALQQQ